MQLITPYFLRKAMTMKTPAKMPVARNATMSAGDALAENRLLDAGLVGEGCADIGSVLVKLFAAALLVVEDSLKEAAAVCTVTLDQRLPLASRNARLG
jgi:hypothetical protein